MTKLSLKRWVISHLIQLRRFQYRYAMIQFVRKNWFYIGILIISTAYFRKDIKAWLKPELPKTEKYTQEKSTGDGQSLFGVGNDTQTGPASASLPEISDAASKNFLRRFAKVVQGEQQKYGVPASALLALAYVNSFSGTRGVATEGNNFFARLCGVQWEGASIDLGGTCYRKYDKAWDSFRDASSQLSATRWAQELVRKKDQKWEHWVQAIAEHEYSDVHNAQAEMGKVIKAYRLFELD